jgi:hypothetical protein
MIFFAAATVSAAAAPCEPSDVIVCPLVPQFGDELLGGALQRGGASTFAGIPVVASKAAPKLTNRQDDKAPQSNVGQRGNKFIQLSWGKARRQGVQTVSFNSHVVGRER